MVITAVAPQPKTFSQRPLTRGPMIARLLPTSMTSSISGGARSPLMVAERNSMRTALTLSGSSRAAGHDGAAQDRIEAPGLGRLEVEAGGPGEELGDRVRGGAGEH